MISTRIDGEPDKDVTPLKRYQVKQTSIEAYEWDGILEGRPGVYQNYQHYELPQERPFVIDSKLQKVYVDAGDYIVKDDDMGHFTAYKPAQFWQRFQDTV